MSISQKEFESSDFELVRNRFNSLIRSGKDFGNGLIKEQKDKSKAILTTLSTPYEFVEDDAKAIKQIEEIDLKDGMKKFVQQVFKHYDVNPSIDGASDKIISTYVTENLQVIPYLRKELNVVNEDDALFDEISVVIKKSREKEDVHQENRKIYITGIKGAGKTSYLNYFISKYEAELNKKKIISIRINVLRINDNDTMENAIRFKTCRILFTYYCTLQNKEHERLKDRAIKNDMDNYLFKIIKESKNKFSEHDIRSCSDYYKNYNAKEPEQIKEIYKDLCDQLLIKIIGEYNFIIMLDNFDQVTPNDKELYNKRIKELEKITTTSFFNHSVYLITIRYNTFNVLHNSARTTKTCRVIGTPTTYDMLNKRISYFSRIHNNDRDRRKISCLKNLILLIANNFMPAAITKTKITDFQEACNLFDDIFYGDKRMIIQMINRFINIIPEFDFEYLCSHEYETIMDSLFDKLISLTYYKIFESLLIDTKTGFCNTFFSYKKVDDRFQFKEINATAHFDENYLPNIYQFAAVQKMKDNQFIPFLKIRILQLLKNYEKNDYRLTQNMIAQKLKEIFDYRNDVVHLACDELRWDQSIIIIEKEPENDTEHIAELRSMPLDITPRGKKLLEILPININLLAVTFEQIFLPVSFLKNGGIVFGNYNDTDISKFIIRNKFYSLPKLIGLLKSIEEHEKNILLTRTKEENKKLFNPESDFSIANRLEEVALHSIEKIYFSFFEVKTDDDVKYAIRRKDLFKQLGL